MENLNEHILSYKKAAIILCCLVSLTALSVYVSFFDFESLTLIIALTIASIKGSIVMLYYMHLKYESIVLKVIIMSFFLFFSIITAVAFLDYFYR